MSIRLLEASQACEIISKITYYEPGRAESLGSWTPSFLITPKKRCPEGLREAWGTEHGARRGTVCPYGICRPVSAVHTSRVLKGDLGEGARMSADKSYGCCSAASWWHMHVQDGKDVCVEA